MSIQTFKKMRSVVVVLSLIITVYAMVTRSVIVALFGIGGLVLLLSLLKTRLNSELADERIRINSGKAAESAFKILLPMLGFSSLLLILASGNTEYHYLSALGYVLSYITSLGLIIYVIAYKYFDNQTGGDER